MPDSLSFFDGCVGRAQDTEGKDNTRVSISAVSGKRLPSGQKSRSARPNTLMNCRRRQRTDVTHITAFHRGPAQGTSVLKADLEEILELSVTGRSSVLKFLQGDVRDNQTFTLSMNWPPMLDPIMARTVA